MLIPFLFLGLLVSCKKDKTNKAEIGSAKEVKAASGSDYSVDNTNSKVLWLGSKPSGTHNGSINVSNGNVNIDGGKLTGGTFTLDMNSITCLDLEGGKKAGLESHLKGTEPGKEDDFFNVTQFPTAEFVITKVTGLEGNTDANAMVFGNLTMKGITKGVGFRANVNVAGNSVTVNTPKFTINRTDWGIKFMSKSFFDNLADKFIDDEIELQINLMAKA